MVLKDHYKVLGVKPSASLAEIKKNYRRLAMKYHPDKNQGNNLAGIVFGEIAEAYSILSNPDKRRQYDYFRAGEVTANYTPNHIVTQADVIKSIDDLERNIAGANQFRINRAVLYFRLTQILSDTNLLLLENIETAEKQEAVIKKLLFCCQPLRYAESAKISVALLRLAGGNETLIQPIQQFLRQSLLSSRWHKYKTLVAVLLAVILCLLIFILSK